VATARSRRRGPGLSDADAVRAALIDGMSEAVLAVDASGRIAVTNRAYDEMFGTDGPWAAEDERGEAMPPDAWPQARAARGESFITSFTIRGADGSRRWFEATSNGTSVRELAGVIVFRDITDRSLRRLQERFMAAASHELRTPVAALGAVLQVARRRLASGDEVDAAAYLERSIIETRRLADLVDRLFDTSLAYEGRLTLRRERADLVRIAADAIDLAGILEPDVTFRLATDQEHVWLSVDPIRLQQVLVNVMVNAATHGRSEGSRVDVEVRSLGDEGRIEVRDHGQGMSDAVAYPTFEAFSTSGPHGEGMGLGLFLAHQIVTAHGGWIDLTPAQGGGTRVRIGLPVEGSPAAQGAVS
jgi:two-component system CheB/CheR fusion protein